MFFKKKAPPPRRTRQPASDSKAGRAVFSYHASRSVRPEGEPGERRPGSLSWTGVPDTKSALPRRAAKPWFKRVWAFVFVTLLVFFALYSLTLSRTPQVIALEERSPNRATMLRSQDSYQEAATELMRRSLANTNKLTIDTKRMAAEMERQFPELAEVSVALPLVGREPVVYVQPAQPVLLLKTANGGVFVLDAAGRAVANASRVAKIEKMELPLVQDQADLALETGDTALPVSNVAFITEVVGQLKAKKLAVGTLTLPRATNELHLQIQGLPYIVKFNLRGDARTEVGAYLATKNHLEREGKTPSSYIDVRVDNRVYYK